MTIGPVPLVVPAVAAAVLSVAVLQATPATPAAPAGSIARRSASGSPATSVADVSRRSPYEPPTTRPVSHGFDAPGRYQAGNRGLDYATAAGDPVVAIGAGTVVFAGPVAGEVWVTVLHPDGLRSSAGPMASVDVSAGDVVARGSRLGAAAGVLHLGVRRGRDYIDPATLFRPRHAHLVPATSG